LSNQKISRRNPLSWVPSLYYAEGIPYVVVTTVSTILYKRMGVSNTDIALYTGWLYLPWVVKPLWSPMVDLLRTKRWWIIIMQLLIGAALGGVALSLQAPFWFQMTLLFFWLLAFSSATHDIAADGFYLIGLNENQQAKLVGVRSLFYRLAMITGQGALVMAAGYFEESTGNIKLAWSLMFAILVGMFALSTLYHQFILPRPVADTSPTNIKNIYSDFFTTFTSFFRKENIAISLIFILFYRLGESQLLKMASPFLMDDRAVGGLGLDTSQVGLLYGTIAVACLMLGGITGGLVASAKGLKYWLWWMTLAINVPHALYLWMAYAQPQSTWIIGTCVAVEQFSYGFGFTAFMLYLIYISAGTHKTAHYAIATGIMALGMMLPQMASGWIQQHIGYQHFFLWVLICAIPGFLIVPHLKIDSEFGKRQQ